IRAASRARQETYVADLITSADNWLPTVQRMRPHQSWDDVVRVLNANGNAWTLERLRRAVHRLVSEGVAQPELLERAPRKNLDDHLMTLVAGIATTGPDLS